MVVVLRGVRMFSGLRTEEGGERPLREVTRLCGLALGDDHAPEDRAMPFDRISQIRQGRQGIRLATVGGKRLDFADQPIGGVGGAQHLDRQGKAGR
ncbi:hypothetical protein D3C72_1335770 [compost metagenome]